MQLRLIGVAAGFLLAISNMVPANATVVYVTYTGTVIRGTDPGDVFGQGANLNGQLYSVLYVFDTGSYADNHPTLNFVSGGTNFRVPEPYNPSPLVGPAILTIGGVNIEIRGDKVGGTSARVPSASNSIVHGTPRVLSLKIRYSIIRAGYQQQSRRHLFIV